VSVIHNVRDGRRGVVGSWEVVPLIYAALGVADIGRTVIYQSHNNAEAGTITSWRDGIVFARYSRGDTAAGASPDALHLAVRSLHHPRTEDSAMNYSIVATNHCGPEAEALIKELKPGEEITLVREPDNRFDKNAVQVWARGIRVGYLPKATNQKIAMAMDQKPPNQVLPQRVECQKPMAESVDLVRGMKGKFALSPNSAFPQVHIVE
jgi:hypothetical protein